MSQTPTNRETLLKLADRCDTEAGPDNRLDVLVEVALFKPHGGFTAARANVAGTKVIYTTVYGQQTHWAEEWTADRDDTSKRLRAIAGGME